MFSRSESARAGLAAVWPLMLGVFPFGMIYGAVAVSCGLSKVESTLMSIFVFAGASQLAALDLMTEGSPLWMVVATALIVNLRYLMYSASLSGYFRDVSPARKIALSYFMTDQAYAVSVSRFSRTGSHVRKPWFYMGAAVAIWSAFIFGTMGGSVLGARLPQGLSLDFAIPVTFIALVVPLLRDRPALMSAMVSGGAALVFNELPLNLGLVAAVTMGITAGTIASGKKKRGENAGV